jgi:uncharacterized membrane protein
MQDLGTLSGSYSYAYAINSAGDAAGGSFLVGDLARHAVIWRATGGLLDLGTLGGTNSSVSGLNSLGEAVGGSDLP